LRGIVLAYLTTGSLGVGNVVSLTLDGFCIDDKQKMFAGSWDCRRTGTFKLAESFETRIYSYEFRAMRVDFTKENGFNGELCFVTMLRVRFSR
jgi:hypothetical protein